MEIEMLSKRPRKYEPIEDENGITDSTLMTWNQLSGQESIFTILDEQEEREHTEINETLSRFGIRWRSKEGELFTSKEEIKAYEELEEIIKCLGEPNEGGGMTEDDS